MMAASRMIGDSTKKSPCFCIQVLFRFNKITYAYS